MTICGLVVDKVRGNPFEDRLFLTGYYGIRKEMTDLSTEELLE